MLDAAIPEDSSANFWAESMTDEHDELADHICDVDDAQAAPADRQCGRR